MPTVTFKMFLPVKFIRGAARSAILGTTILFGAMTAARAGTETHAVMLLAQAAAPAPAASSPAAPQNRTAAGATETKGETVEQRIINLHTALKITPEQEVAWKAVAVAMRENATKMDTLIASSRATPPQTMTALEDLAMYQKFAQAHVDSLKNLITAFDTLYATMPAAQKKVADDVFNAPAPAATHG